MTLDERIEALTMNLELASRDIEALRAAQATTTANIDKLVAVTNQDAIAIRTLARVADAHEARLRALEG